MEWLVRGFCWLIGITSPQVVDISAGIVGALLFVVVPMWLLLLALAAWNWRQGRAEKIRRHAAYEAAAQAHHEQAQRAKLP